MRDAASQTFRTLELSDPRFEQEGLRQVVVKSRALRRRADITVFVPSGKVAASSLLILLHGVYGSHWSWTQRTGVHRIAQRMIDSREIEPMVLAMPSDALWGDGSGYLTHADCDAERWTVEEVVEATAAAAPTLAAGARLSIAGLSMGGYGALRLGAKFPHLFESISAHSAIAWFREMAGFVEEPLESYAGNVPLEELDPLFWIKRNRARLPRLRFDCGLSDTLLEGNRRLHGSLEFEGIPHRYEEFDGGHEWSYWESNVARTLRFANEAAS